MRPRVGTHPVGARSIEDPPLASTSDAASWLAAASVSCLIIAIPFGGSTPIPLLLASIATGIVAILRARIDPGQRWEMITLWPPVLLMAAMCLSILNSALPALAIERSATMPVHAMAFVLVQIAAWHGPALRVIFASCLAALVGLGLDPLFEVVNGAPLFTDLDAIRVGRVSGSQGNPNDFAATAILMPLASAALGPERRALGITIAAIVAVPGWAITASRQALLGWLIAIGLSAPGSLGRRRTWWIAGGLVVGIAVLTLAIPTTRARLIQTFEGDLSGRPELIAYGVSLAAEHSITGIGPGVFGEYYVDAVATNWTWRGRVLRQYGVPWVHNLPLEIALELGVCGLLVTAAIVTVALRRSLVALRSADPDWRLVGLTAGGGIAVWLLVGQLDLTLIKDWFRCLFWVTLGLAYSVPQTSTESRLIA
jgi:hypothetical protein